MHDTGGGVVVGAGVAVGAGVEVGTGVEVGAGVELGMAVADGVGAGVLPPSNDPICCEISSILTVVLQPDKTLKHANRMAILSRITPTLVYLL